MDGPKFDPKTYRQKYEKLGITDEGEIVAIITSSRGDRYVVDEEELFEVYEESATHNSKSLMQTDMKALSNHAMEVTQEARGAIQDYKKRHGIPFDTPPVEETPPVRPLTSTPAANNENYGADILTPNF